MVSNFCFTDTIVFFDESYQGLRFVIISKGAIQIISRCEALFHHSLWTEFSYILTCLSSRFESVHYFKATNELETSDKRWPKRSFSLLILYFSSLLN